MEMFGELVRELWQDPAARSRNRHFGRFRDDPAYRRAVLTVRSLLSFQRDLRRFRGRADVVVAQGHAERIRLTLTVRVISFRRTLFVSHEELDLIREDLWPSGKMDASAES